jgi:dipeptidase D
MKISELNPVSVWNYFDQITQVPRPSKKEGKIVKFLLDFAKENGLDAKKDDADNVIIRKPASKGKENLKTLILQSHIDMVCEKNSDIDFNFDTDAIKTRIDGEWVKATGTTLGADDGIGVAAAMAVLASKDIEHGPIVALFTSDEETGLTGANALTKEYLEGDILLNLDSEEWGDYCIGCAGGKNTKGIFTYKPTTPPADYFWLEVKISGLQGGHSGSEINVGLGNANKLLNRYLWALAKETPLSLAKIDGGNLHNAIPREASATIGVPQDYKEKAVALANIYQSYFSDELAKVDKNVKISAESASAPEFVIDETTAKNLLNAIYALPHGVIGMSHTMEGLVETSTNLASIKMSDGKITVTTSQRSSTESLKYDIYNRVCAVFELAGAEVIGNAGYPGWKPNPDSEILDISIKAFERLFGKKPRIYAIHAGLECGLFYERNPKLDMLSCGPTILGAHSPDERLEIATVEKWWRLIQEILKSIPEK